MIEMSCAINYSLLLRRRVPHMEAEADEFRMNGEEIARISQMFAGLRAGGETSLRNGERPPHTLAETIADEITLRFFPPSIRTGELF
jgi:hypothetical protein